MALVFDIKRYSIHDGPGIRTTIFIKGCPLRCVWCHNPESWSPLRQRLYKKNKCIGCGSCVNNCPNGAVELSPEGVRPTMNKCVVCGKCAEICPTLAMENCGKDLNIESLLEVIEKERSIMEHGKGGVTVSGGEPLMHPDFTLSFLQTLGRKRFHRALDTTLFASRETVRAVADECELFLVDLKCMDPEKHKKFTGVDNDIILQNLRLIAELDHPYFIRIPLIKEVNATNENIEETISFLLSLHRKPEFVDLLPYHDIGKGKHERMGSVYNPDNISLSAPSQEEIEKIESTFKKNGFNVRIGG